MPRPQVDTKCLEHIRSVMEQSEDIINRAKDTFVLAMLQQNDEVTDCITAACFTFARIFAEKFGIEPSRDNLQKLIGDAVFMSGMAPLVKALIKADEEAT